MNVKVSYHWPIWLNCLFLAIFPHLKKKFNCFSKPSTSLSTWSEGVVNNLVITLLSKATLFYRKICPAICLTKLYYLIPRTIFLHSNQNMDHFLNPLIKGFQESKLKMRHSLKIGAFISSLSNIYVPGQKGRKIYFNE